jgi:ATP-binding cassette subfamily B protein
MSVPPLDLDLLAWPLPRLGEALETTAQQTGLVPWGRPATRDHSRPAWGPDANEASITQWVAQCAGWLGIEAEPVASSYREVAEMVRGAAPALLRLPPEKPQAPPRYLVLLNGGRRLTLLGPDLKTHRVPSEAVRAALCQPLIAPWVEITDSLLAMLGGKPRADARRERARQILLEEQFSAVQVSGGWLLRVTPGANPWQQAQRSHLPRPLLILFGTYLLQESLLVFAWWLIGRGVFSGQFETAWLWGWALVLFTAIPFQLLGSWAQGQLSVGAGALFKQRLLFGTLKMQPDELRRQGMGQFLGRVMEAEAVELLALGGGLIALISLVQLGVAAWVLAQGAGGWGQVGLLALWSGITLLAGGYAYRRGHAWMTAYRGMTNNLVERMVGHRTRLAQEAPHTWHAGEDQELAHYQTLSQAFDRSEFYLSALPASWLLVGLAGLVPDLLTAPATMPHLAVSLGGVMLAYQAFLAIQLGMQSLIQLGLSWQQVKPVFHAAARPEEPAAVMLRETPKPAPSETPPAEQSPLLVARHLSFRYHAHGRQVLHDCSLQIRPGDRLLLEGPSGGGKTTLAALLAGLRQPETGALLLHGYDRQSLGAAAWRRRVVIAPQFHENHIFSETFAFNLLMGRGWPPTPADLQEAETICAELGLGDLLARMPAGWQQLVGENGWQLSHGERSRVFIARALLQNADFIIMDESFGALDPENLYRALACARRRAATLLVIAHP